MMIRRSPEEALKCALRDFRREDEISVHKILSVFCQLLSLSPARRSGYRDLHDGDEIEIGSGSVEREKKGTHLCPGQPFFCRAWRGCAGGLWKRVVVLS